MRTTLGQAKSASSGIAQAIGINACSPKFTALVNQAQQLLGEAGIWWGTYRRLYVCSTQDCITWPSDVASIQGAKIGSRGISIANGWYDFGPEVAQSEACCESDPRMVDRQNVPQFSALPSSAGMKLRIYPTVAADSGQYVVIQGLDSEGNQIRTQQGSSYGDGERVTIASPFVETSFRFYGSYLTGVQKPTTKGTLNVFAVDLDSGSETKIAFWGPNERNPSYRRSYVPNLSNSCGTSTCCSGSNGCETPSSCPGTIVEAVARLEAVEVSSDTDWLLIGNLLALKHAIKSIVKSDQNQYQEASVEFASAIRILRNELEKYDPAVKTRVNVKAYGTASPCRVFGGFR